MTHLMISLINKHTFNKIKLGCMLSKSTPTTLVCEMHSVIIG